MLQSESPDEQGITGIAGITGRVNVPGIHFTRLLRLNKSVGIKFSTIWLPKQDLNIDNSNCYTSVDGRNLIRALAPCGELQTNSRLLRGEDKTSPGMKQLVNYPVPICQAIHTHTDTQTHTYVCM